jgi:hypothetical protein
MALPSIQWICPFRGQDQRPEIKEFLNVMTQIDEYMIQKGVENSVAWFKSKLSEDVIRAFLHAVV